MSRKSRQEQLSKRLKALLADLLIEQGADIPAITQNTNHTGWTWQCDSEGIYTACSPEVLHVVGYEPDEVIGSSFVEFGMSSRSRDELGAAMERASEAFEIVVQFSNANGDTLDLAVNAMPDRGEDGSAHGWRGFMQVRREMEDILDGGGFGPFEAYAPIEAVETAPTSNGPTDEEIVEMSDRIEKMIDTGELVLPDGRDDTLEDLTLRGVTGAEQMQAEESAFTSGDGSREITETEQFLEKSGQELVSDTDELSIEGISAEHAAEEEKNPVMETAELSAEETGWEYGLVKSGATKTPVEDEDGEDALSKQLDLPVEMETEQVTADEQDDQAYRIETNPVEDEKANVVSMMADHPESQVLAFQETASLDPSILSDPKLQQIHTGRRTLPEILDPTTQELLDAIDSDPDREWTEDELLLVEQVTGQLALALENARLFNQTQVALAETDEQAKRLSLLNQLGDSLNQAKNLEEIFALSVMKAQEIFDTNHASIATLNNQASKLVMEAEIDNRGFISKGREIAFEESPYRFAAIENRIFINPEVIDPNLGGVRSFMVAPLVVGGEVAGVMTAGSYRTNAFTRVDGDFLQQLVSLVGSMVDNRRLFEAVQSALSESEEQGRRLKLLNEMSEELAQATSMGEIARTASEKTVEIFRSHQASMLVVDTEKKLAEVLAKAGEGDGDIGLLEIDWDGPLGKAVQMKRLVVDEIRVDEKGSMFRSNMTAPIIIDGEVICAVSVGMEGDHLFTSTDQNMLSQITSLLAGTLENSRLFTQIQRRSTQLQAAAEVSRMAGGILDSSELLQNVIEAIRDGFNLYYTGIFLVDESGEWTGEPDKWAVLQAGTGDEGTQMLIAGHKLEIGGESMIGSAIADGEARIAFDVGKEAVFFRNPYLPDTRSEMALPLISRGEVIGALTIQSREEAAFTQEDITALQTMADQVANTIENVNLFEQSQKRATELSVLNEMASTFTQTLELNTIFDHMYQYTSRLMDARNFYIAIYDKDRDEIHLPLFKFRGSDHEDQGIRRQSGNGITEWIIRNRLPVLLRENAGAWIQERNLEMRGFDAQSWMGVPMLRGNDVIGVIAVQSYSTARKYSQHELDLLSAVASQAGIAIENARLFMQTQARAQIEQERATQERLVRTITERMRSGQDIPTILKITLDELEKAFGVDVSMIRLADRDQMAAASLDRFVQDNDSKAIGSSYEE